LLGLRLRQRWDQSVTAEQRRAAGQESKKHKYFPSQRVLGSKEIEHDVSTGVTRGLSNPIPGIFLCSASAGNDPIIA